MDLVFLVGVALLWWVMVWLVAGFRRLERPQGGRS
jgi:cytochrome c oxidase assembly factor CtaG